MHYFLLIFSIVSLYMFRAGLLLIITRIDSALTAIGTVNTTHDYIGVLISP